MPDIDLDPKEYTRQGKPRIVARSTMWWAASVCTVLVLVLIFGMHDTRDAGAAGGIAILASIVGSSLAFLFPRFFFVKPEKHQ